MGAVTRALLFACVCACSPVPVPVPVLGASASASASASALSGDISVSGGTPKGRLVIGWRTKDEQKIIDGGGFSMRAERDLISRWRVAEEIDFAKTAHTSYRIEGAPRDATPVVVLDVEHTFWATVFGQGIGQGIGQGKGFRGSASSGGGPVVLRANPVRPAEEACAGPRYRLFQIDSPGLPTPKRRFCAWLPEGFDDKKNEARRYPIVFMLPGFMSTDVAYLRGNRHMGLRADAIAKETKREVVLVGVDTSTPTGSTYLEDSGPNGPFATFLATRALPEIEKGVHGIAKRTGRALIGQSTGGFNALSLGMRRSDLFSVIGASSPDAPDPAAWLLEDEGKSRRAREWLRRWTVLEDALGGTGQMTSYAADWSSGKWPFDLATGAVVEPVLAQWVAKSPHGMLADPPTVARLKQDLSGRILVIVGRNDEFDLFPSAERFALELADRGIETRFVATDHGHGDGNERLETSLRFALERLDGT